MKTYTGRGVVCSDCTMSPNPMKLPRIFRFFPFPICGLGAESAPVEELAAAAEEDFPPSAKTESFDIDGGD